MPFYKSMDDMLSEALTTLTARTGITSIDEDSISRLLIELPLKEIADLQEQLYERDNQFRLTTADYNGLDWIGELHGISRKTNTVGKTSNIGMKFYTDSAAPQGGYTIPAGTAVWDPTSAIYVFYTTSNITIPEGGTYALTGIVAPFSGGAGSAIGTLTMHNGSQHVKCVNLESLSGTSEEDNEQYRYRLMNARAYRNGLITDAIRTKLLAHPTVLDCRILPRKRGNGTIDAIVYTAESVPTQATLDDIKDRLKSIVADGISVKVYAPTPVIVDVTAKIAISNKKSIMTIEQIRQIAQTGVITHLNTRDLGETIYPDEIERIILNASDAVIDVIITEMGVDGNATPVDSVIAGPMQRIVAGRIIIQ